jgi:molecular chaperone IbpA
MTGVSKLFPRASFVGFDSLLNELSNAAQQANEHYPPHNIVKISNTDYLIEMAVAGFARNELDIEVKDRTLIVSGEHEGKGREYIHRGISTKKFKRTFRLSEYVEVYGANLEDGVLSVELKVVVPEEMRPRKISIEDKRNDTTHNNYK